MRPMLRAIACAWLLCQVAGFIAAPVAVCVGSAEAATFPDEACCPGVLPGQVCPMHHTREGAKHCALRGDCSSSTAALLTLVGGVGLLPPAVSSPADCPAAGGSAPLLAQTAISRVQLPESPPPRA